MGSFRSLWNSLAAIVLLTGCQSATISEENGLPETINEHGQIFVPLQTPLPDMDSLLKVSVIGLTAVKKSAKLNSDSTGAEYKVKDPIRELEALSILAELNKPVYRDRYVEHAGQDKYSNLFVRRLVSLDSAAPIRRLEISHLTSADDIRRISAQIVRSNYLFEKREQVVIDFDANPFRISRFAVTGEQKVTGFSVDHYNIQLSLHYLQ